MYFFMELHFIMQQIALSKQKNKFFIVIHDFYRKSVICIQVWLCVCLIVFDTLVSVLLFYMFCILYSSPCSFLS